jgi:hypothetical protein
MMSSASSNALPMQASRGLRTTLMASALFLALLPVAAAPAAVQAKKAARPTVVSCPERIRTVDATAADPGRFAGFTPVIRRTTSQQAFLQGVALHAGSANAGGPLQGKADTRQIVWTFDGATEVVASCIYEGGISLTRSFGRPKTCTAAIRRSKDTRDRSGWGMEQASFRCQ